MTSEQLTPESLKEIWDSVREKKPLSGLDLSLPKSVIVYQTMNNCHKVGSTDPVNEAKLSPEERETLSEFLKPRIMNAVARREIKWDVDVIVANKHVQKSLHIVNTLHIQEERLEMNMEHFSTLRYELARALQTMQRSL